MEEYTHIKPDVLHRKLTESLVKLEKQCESIKSLPMNCLVHRDYYFGNLELHHHNGTIESKGTVENETHTVTRHGGQVQFFDFGSSVCTHPIFDLMYCDAATIELYCGGPCHPDFPVVMELLKLATRLANLIDAFHTLLRARHIRDSVARKNTIETFQTYLEEVLDEFM